MRHNGVIEPRGGVVERLTDWLAGWPAGWLAIILWCSNVTFNKTYGMAHVFSVYGGRESAGTTETEQHFCLASGHSKLSQHMPQAGPPKKAKSFLPVIFL